MMRYDEVVDTVAGFRDSARRSNQLVRDVNSLVESMSFSWVGEAYNAFYGKQQEIVPTLNRFSELCDAIAEQLDQAVKAMEAADSRIASQVNSGVIA